MKYAKDLGQGLRFLNGLEMKDQKKFRDVLISNLNNKSFMKAVCYGVLPQKALTVFKDKLKTLLVDEAYKFSIQRTQKDTLIISLTSKEDFYGDPDQIEENLKDLIRSLMSAIVSKILKMISIK